MIRPPSSSHSEGESRGPGKTFRGLFLLVATGFTLGWPLGPQASDLFLQRYDFSKDGGSRHTLPRALEEISGLTLTPEGHLLAHDDERAVVYQIDPRDGTVLKSFAVGMGGIRGDFEGIASVGPRLFLMTSAGELLETSEGEDGQVMPYRLHNLSLAGLCEFEGLAYDPGSHTLLLPCKKTKSKEMEDHVVVLEAGLEPLRIYPVPRVFIPFVDLKAMDLGKSFHPSAMEVHPRTGRGLLLSAQQESVLEVSPQGALLGGRDLRRKDHPQPEGITFLGDDTLVLADEGQGKKGRLTTYRPAPASSGSVDERPAPAPSLGSTNEDGGHP